MQLIPSHTQSKQKAMHACCYLVPSIYTVPDPNQEMVLTTVTKLPYLHSHNCNQDNPFQTTASLQGDTTDS